jgi:hypothetical protein
MCCKVSTRWEKPDSEGSIDLYVTGFKKSLKIVKSSSLLVNIDEGSMTVLWDVIKSIGYKVFNSMDILREGVFYSVVGLEA